MDLYVQGKAQSHALLRKFDLINVFALIKDNVQTLFGMKNMSHFINKFD